MDPSPVRNLINAKFYIHLQYIFSLDGPEKKKYEKENKSALDQKLEMLWKELVRRLDIFFVIQKRWMDRAGHFSRMAFSPKFLLPTNVCICVCLSGVGDYMQQNWKRLRMSKAGLDLRRTTKMALAGASVGVLCHYWYLWLDRFLTGYSLSVVMKKVVMDQVLLSPVMWAAYFAFVTIYENGTWCDFKQKITSSGSKLYLTEWLVWPPAQVINFYFLPTRFRVLYDSTVSFGFDVYVSHLLHEETPGAVDDKCQNNLDVLSKTTDDTR